MSDKFQPSREVGVLTISPVPSVAILLCYMCDQSPVMRSKCMHIHKYTAVAILHMFVGCLFSS